METNPLFYQSVVALNRERHRALRLQESDTRFAFCRDTHVIPAVVDEFAAALAHLPIVFAPSSPFPTTVFLVGVRAQRNLFVDPQGRWTGGYVPAFVRRYPFMRGEINGSAPVTCVDERSSLLSSTEGERLFDDQGRESPLLARYVDLVDKYYQSAARTQAFLSVVHELQLLRNVTIETTAGAGASSVIHGFLTIDEARLDALPAGQLLRLRDGGFLAPIYAHLFSLRAVEVLRRQVSGEASGEARVPEGQEQHEGVPG